MKVTSLYLITILAAAMLSGACESAVSTNNTAGNVRNANSNVAVVTNNNTNVATDRDDADITREDYDRNRAKYEEDKGASTIGQGANDSWIWFKTKTALAATDDLRDSTINVDVANDKITLRGTVGTQAQKASAERVAKSIEGNAGVSNQLTIKANDSMTNQMVNGNSANND